MDGLIAYVALAAALLLGGWLFPHLGKLLRCLRSVGRRTHLLPEEVPPPAERSIERLSADLRRLRSEARNPPPGITMARHLGAAGRFEARVSR